MKPRKTPVRAEQDKPSGKSRRSGLSQGQKRYYSRSRQRQHDAAETGGEPPKRMVPDHPLICPDEPELITDADALAELLTHLRASGSFAYDTEFIGELTYYPKLCVIQVATTDRIALVDPLASLDLADFWALVADPAVETIVHAGVQDLEPVYRHTGHGPEGIFDTQIAMGFTALPYPLSLREAVRLLLNAKLGKGMTFTQWDQRPLSSAQMQYAADDVRFLPALRGEVGARLAAAGHTEWAAAECAALADPALYEFNALTQCRRIRGTRDLTARQLATLTALLQWRERCARAEGIPARSLVKDEILKAMARRPAKSPEDLSRAASLSRNVIRTEGENIVRAIDQARAMDEKDLPPVRPQVESGIQRHRIDCAWAFVQAWCFGQSVHPNLISSRQELADLLVADSLAEAVGQSRLGRGWRKELLGGRLEGFLAGTTALHLQWNDDGELRSELNTESSS